MAPGVDYEQNMCAAGHLSIAGIDEVGRGCWAGPVVAAAVVLLPRVLEQPALLADVDDSKLLTPRQREHSYEHITALAQGVGVGIVPAYVIDAFGIVQATRLAMTIAILSLPCRAEALLIDGMALNTLSLPQQTLIKGDSRCLSIAAASVVAKVTRDRLMGTAELAFPGYGFAAHKGYGTAAHQQALQRLGPCALHRMTFRPLYCSTVA